MTSKQVGVQVDSAPGIQWKKCKWITRDMPTFAMLSKVRGIASGSLGRTPVSDFCTNSDAKVIFHDFFGVGNMPPEATSGHIT